MERNTGYFQNNSGSFSRGRNDFRQQQGRSNFNSAQPNVWMQNNPQMTQNVNPWHENQRNVTSNDIWSNLNPGNWHPGNNSNQIWSQPGPANDNGYWRQVSGNTGNDGRQSHSRQFNNRERRTPYSRPNRGGPNRGQRRDRPNFVQESRREREPSPDLEPEPVNLTPMEAKIERLISAVQNQPDNLGQLILLQNNNEIPPVLLHNAAHQVKNCTVTIDRNESNGYSKLRINNTVIAEGMWASKKEAKESLYEMGLDIMKSKCFYITSKSHYEEVSMDALSQKKEEEVQQSPMEGNSKALQMMLKMGWGGKGLGNKEQGEQKSVAEKIVENISREGLGGSGKTVMQEVDKILADYAKSTKTTTLGFDSGFTKEERAQIHSIAAKYHLKSKSEGGFNSRRITISKKLSKWILIRELLGSGLENESYILSIPDEFQDLWTEDNENENE